jgi:stage V sporulation protein B
LKKSEKTPKKEKVSAKTVLKLSIPVTFSSILLPLSGLLDSVLAPRLLSAYAEDAVALFGLFSGGAVTIINLPVSVCYGIAAASVPAVASSDKPRKKIFFSLWITLLIALPSALGLYVFAEPVSKIIFRSLTGAELQTLSGLVKAFSVSALTLSCVQTLAACLTAQGKPQYAAISMLIAVTVKTLIYWAWMKNPNISVFGLAYATNICYLVAFLLDLLYNLRVSKTSAKAGERKK